VQGLRSMALVKLGLVALASYGLLMSLSLHLIPILTAGGIARDTAVVVAGSYGLSMILGNVIAGLGVDRVSGRVVMVVCLVVLSASCALLALPTPSLKLAAVSVFLFGLSFGGIGPTLPYLATRYFGLRSFGRLFGILNSLCALAAAIGPLLAGFVYDMTHSYLLFLLGAIVALLIAILLVASLGPYPDFSEPAKQPARG
jgi:MFS family permease